MNSILLVYKTLINVTEITMWGLGLLTGFLGVRLIRDLYGAYSEDEGLRAALKKMKKRIFATLIAFTVTSFVAWIKRYY